MPAYPYCKSCLVVEAVRTLMAEYEYFLAQTDKPMPVGVTDHARGYLHGRKLSVEEYVNDLRKVLPYMEVEQSMRGGR